MSEEDVLGLFETCSNAGRWGAADEIGTANFITEEKRVAAAALVRTGRTISLARDLSRLASPTNQDPLGHRMLLTDLALSCIDVISIAPHGFAVTHLDAIGHVFFHGHVYNNRRAVEVVSPDGLGFASILALKRGIVTRGILLDVARARGVMWLEPGEGVEPEDLERAEQLAGVQVSRGDALFVRTGLGAREAALGEEDPTRRAGLTARCIPWLHNRELAVYSGDCVEQMPSPYPRVPLPLHQVASAAMGLVLLDNPPLEELTAALRDVGRFEFLLVCAPLPIPRGTGSPVNPIAVL
jgi:kynurenine formamidase